MAVGEPEAGHTSPFEGGVVCHGSWSHRAQTLIGLPNSLEGGAGRAVAPIGASCGGGNFSAKPSTEIPCRCSCPASCVSPAPTRQVTSVMFPRVGLIGRLAMFWFFGDEAVAPRFAEKSAVAIWKLIGRCCSPGHRGGYRIARNAVLGRRVDPTGWAGCAALPGLVRFRKGLGR
jgi:hypothetical protein